MGGIGGGYQVVRGRGELGSGDEMDGMDEMDEPREIFIMSIPSIVYPHNTRDPLEDSAQLQ